MPSSRRRRARVAFIRNAAERWMTCFSKHMKSRNCGGQERRAQHALRPLVDDRPLAASLSPLARSQIAVPASIRTAWSEFGATPAASRRSSTLSRSVRAPRRGVPAAVQSDQPHAGFPPAQKKKRPGPSSGPGPCQRDSIRTARCLAARPSCPARRTPSTDAPMSAQRRRIVAVGRILFVERFLPINERPRAVLVPTPTRPLTLYTTVLLPRIGVGATKYVRCSTHRSRRAAPGSK